MITDVSRLRPYRCTIIASITSNGMRGEGEMLRHLGLTGDIRAPGGAGCVAIRTLANLARVRRAPCEGARTPVT
jgi:hypothetical protein